MTETASAFTREDEDLVRRCRPSQRPSSLSPTGELSERQAASMGPGKSELERESFSSVLIVTLIARWVVGLRYHPAGCGHWRAKSR